jgi:murein DD-endopeptidase MepM/ murein hydrolase activator NlpD
MTTSHRDLALLDPWTRSLERSLHRRAITPQVRRSTARRRRASIALSTLMVAGPTGSLLAAAGFGLGGRGVDVAAASPANRAIDTGATPDAMAFELGDRGAAIAEIQRQLGMSDDGIFGPLTHAAVTDFQARNGLEVDGIVGPVTWTALFGLAQAAAAAGAGEGDVAVILRERGDSSATDSQPAPDAAEQPAVGGGDAPDDVAAPGTSGDGATTPDTDTTPAPAKPVSTPPPSGGACGSLRLASPVDGTVTSGYGPRWGRNHDGLDIAAPTGTPIRAAECGVVSFAGVQSGYGNMVCVQHSSRFETCYAHMTHDAVSQGQRVERGQVIGYVGCTGSCTGPHLHFETRVDGVARDPRPYLGGAGVPGEPTVKAAAAKAQLTASIRKDVAQARVTARTTLVQQRATTTLAPTSTAQQPVATTGIPAATTTPAAAPAPTATPVYEAPATSSPEPAPAYEQAAPTAPEPPAAPPVTTPAPPVTEEPAYVAPVEEPAPAYTAPVEPVYEAPATPQPAPTPEPVPTPTAETPPEALTPAP